jgi:hypothetical protein
MHNTGPATFRQKKYVTVSAMPWDGTLAGAQYIIKWLQSHEGVTAHHIENRFGDAAISIDQPNFDTTYMRPHWVVFEDDGEFWAYDPFQFRAEFEPDEDTSLQTVERVRLLRDSLAAKLEEQRDAMPGPIAHIYKSFVDVIDEALEGSSN